MRGWKTFDILIMITILGILSVVVLVTSSDNLPPPSRTRRLSPREKRDLRSAQIAGLAVNTNPSSIDTCQLYGLDSIMVERVSGTPENKVVRKYIVDRLRKINFDVEFDTFTQDTVNGEIEFSNIIGFSNKNAEKHVIITAHYDSKLMDKKDGKPFVAAIDSAVPCAMILSMMDNLADLLARQRVEDPSRGIVVVFFDGEEAFKSWTDTDSVYGSRHLAEKWHSEGFFEKMELFVLLDLLGAKGPILKSSFPETKEHFVRMNELENELNKNPPGLYTSHKKVYFQSKGSIWGIEDDHKPFERKGYRNIVHIIAAPFPPQWHNHDDDGDHLDCPTIHNLQSVIQLWIAEIFNLHKIINIESGGNSTLYPSTSSAGEHASIYLGFKMVGNFIKNILNYFNLIELDELGEVNEL